MLQGKWMSCLPACFGLLSCALYSFALQLNLLNKPDFERGDTLLRCGGKLEVGV